MTSIDPRFSELPPDVLAMAPSSAVPTAEMVRNCPVLGSLRLVACAEGLLRIDFLDAAPRRFGTSEATSADDAAARGWLEHGSSWLETYSATGKSGPLPRLALKGTAFQRSVWTALAGLAAGCTVTYRELGERIGKPNAARCIGGAVGRNPLPIMVPCHRVLASGGQLGGFSGGLWRKRALLGLEKIGYRDEDGVWVNGGPRDLRLTA